MSIADRAREVEVGFELWRNSLEPGSPAVEEAENQLFRFNLWTSNNFIFNRTQDRTPPEVIEETLDQLFRFSRAVRRSGILHRFIKIANYVEYSPEGINLTEEFRKAATQLVKHHLKKSAATPNLRERLIETICLRQQNFSYLKSRKSRVKEDLSVSTEKGSSSAARSVLSTTFSIGSSMPRSPRKKSMQIQHAQKLEHSILSATTVQYTGAPLEQSVQASINYHVPEIKDEDANLPKPPVVPSGQKEWECPYCLLLCPVKEFSGELWRKHIIGDIMPYICILETCPTPNTLFKSSKDWMTHMGKEHVSPGKWTCMDSAHESPCLYESRSEFQDHMFEFHADQFDESDLEDLLEACYESKSGNLSLSKCPFCDEQDETTLNTDGLFSHVAQHLLSFSRISLEGYFQETVGTSDVSGTLEETTHDGDQELTGTIKEGLEMHLQDFTGDTCDDLESLSTVLALDIPPETENDQWDFYWQAKEVPSYDQTTDPILSAFVGKMENVQVGNLLKGGTWDSFYQVPKQVVQKMSKTEIARQNTLHEIVVTENRYLKQLDVVQTLYRDNLVQAHSPILSDHRKMDFAKRVFGGIDAVQAVNREFMFKQLVDCQKRQGPFIVGFGSIFCDWVAKARNSYLDYSAAFPQASNMVRKEAASNPQFNEFLGKIREHRDSERLAWDTYLKSPILRVSRYLLLLRSVRRRTAEDNEDLPDLTQAITLLESLQADCGKTFERMQKRVELLELISKLDYDHSAHLDMANFDIRLREQGREIMFQGPLRQRETRGPLERLTKQPWTEKHGILLDNYFVLTTPILRTTQIATKKFKGPFSFLARSSPTFNVKGYQISEAPIPIHLLDLEADIETNHSFLSTGILDSKKLPPIKIRHLGKNKVFNLHALSPEDYLQWMQKIIEAKTKYASSLVSLNQEPYKLNPVMNSVFEYSENRWKPSLGSIVAPGTALDRAMKDARTRSLHPTTSYPKVHIGNVNCAVTINPTGVLGIRLIGTDDGVFILGPDSSSWGATKILPGHKVTQIHVFEEHKILIFLADNKLFALQLHGLGLPFEVFAPEAVASFADRAPRIISRGDRVKIFAAGHENGNPMLMYGSSIYSKGIEIQRFNTVVAVDIVADTAHGTLIERHSIIPGEEQFVRLGRHRFMTKWLTEIEESRRPWLRRFPKSLKISHMGSSLIRMTPERIDRTSACWKFPYPFTDIDTGGPTDTCRLGDIVGRDSRPLGMFELTDRQSRLAGRDYLAVYESIAIYLDTSFNLSQKKPILFECIADSAFLDGRFLILFHEELVEVHDVVDGSLRQVIAGRQIKCLIADSGCYRYKDDPNTPRDLDAAQSSFHQGEGRGSRHQIVKFAMQHPEYESRQIIFELILNPEAEAID
ncbi:CNH domain protein [Penicillium brevicompactum]|uniref:CNH domain protein n=1 Tax=Penicillium brevicompactum TaxID=5074 RepID=A0A9W9UIN9_PENBR|nr:CNH domain protein [Penicillium brevicompactum]